MKTKEKTKEKTNKKPKATDTFELIAFPDVRIPIHAKRISTLELYKLTERLSGDIPAIVVMRPRRMQYTGIGWIDCGVPKGDETAVTK